jgi:hypothetical protein
MALASATRTAPSDAALFHRLLQMCPRRLLLGREHALSRYRRQTRDGLTVAGDDEFLARLNLADAAGELLVGVAQGERLGQASNVVRSVLHRSVAGHLCRAIG